MTRERRDIPPESRCLFCGCPAADHTAVRYTVRVWLLHFLPARVCRWLRPLRR